MTRTVELQYIFDPFCGWCYASAPALAGLADAFPDALQMMPSGLFFGSRPIAAMADHAWENDQRIAALTGQAFSEDYHRDVLLAKDGVFSSAVATRALQALGEIDRALEAAFLHDVQIARYVEGRDTAQESVVAEIAVGVAEKHGVTLNIDTFAERLRSDEALHQRTLQRLGKGQQRMEALGIHGVPQLVVTVDGKPTILNGEVLYRGPERLMSAIGALTQDA